MKALVGVLSAILLGDVTGNIGQTAYGLSEDPGSANALSGDMCLSNRYSAAAALNSQFFMHLHLWAARARIKSPQRVLNYSFQAKWMRV